jgi:hypothetical protein
MNLRLVLLVFLTTMYSGCYQANTKQTSIGKEPGFVYKETIVKGKDTGMVRLGAFKRNNVADILCQRWQLENKEDVNATVIPDLESRKSIIRDMVLFRDSTTVLNPMDKLMLGSWQIRTVETRKLLLLQFQNGSEKQYIIQELTSNHMELGLPDNQAISLQFSAAAQLHQNMLNDPFHPINNQWRVKPLLEETDSAVHARIKNCLLFYALYYRDHIKREAETISFEELPIIFEWYNGGIGLPDRDKLADSWVECFYNKEQALKGYAILRKLIVDYEFKWPKGAPGWIYRTHAVLEQMYHKVDDLKPN